MINGRPLVPAAALVTLAACSRTDQSNEQVQAANTAGSMENMHNQMMANGMVANGMMAPPRHQRNAREQQRRGQ